MQSSPIQSAGTLALECRQDLFVFLRVVGRGLVPAAKSSIAQNKFGARVVAGFHARHFGLCEIQSCSGRRDYGFAITLLSLRDISPIRGIFAAPTGWCIISHTVGTALVAVRLEKSTTTQGFCRFSCYFISSVNLFSRGKRISIIIFAPNRKA